MNMVYVVSSCWWRDGATVIGVAADRGEAEVLADRYDLSDETAAGWAGWKEEILSGGGAFCWRRDAINIDGSIHVSLFQEIVCVPMVGRLGD